MTACPKCKGNGLHHKYVYLTPVYSCLYCGFIHYDNWCPDSAKKQIDTTQVNEDSWRVNPCNPNSSQHLNNGNKTQAEKELFTSKLGANLASLTLDMLSPTYRQAFVE